jgi:hypothetical protein
MSSETFDELDSSSSNGSFRVVVQGESDDDQHIGEVEDPIRSKATFRRVEAGPKLYIPLSLTG